MSRSITLAVATRPMLRKMFFPPPLDAELAAVGQLRSAPPGADPTDPECYADLLADADAVVTGWGCPPLSGPVLARAPRLRLLAHTGASVRSLVTAESFARGVRVTQAGAAMGYAVGEQALALTLALLHQVHRFDHALRTGGGTGALVVLDSGDVYIGGAGNVYRLRWGSQTPENLGKPVANQTVTYSLTIGDDGLIYGVTYPGAALFSIDPSNDAVHDFGSLRQALRATSRCCRRWDQARS